ncbi:nuclear transport factor 2 family protein [Phytohabitans suffuscus]|uniref:SnoaL-like domain-containing protein n=1 Tax=Phytohabitans suffuscus TaxID=624315 RepID=A0A6F8YCG0_9ACTN|nr:nuclear transport factor 2 family protein [Phytohabitans suffuscus]BCB83747.1 hypothetical protein Psuf_010600 [Phytohabitans suffuscus]
MRRLSVLAAQVRALAARVAELEDRLEIARLIAAYGPAADSGSARATAALWAEDGRYDAGIVTLEGAPAIAEMIATDPHRGFIATGAAHIVSPPHIELHGDRATVTCYQQVLLRNADTDDYRTWRVSANRWEWARTPAGWRVTARYNRLLDGSDAARALFRAAFEEGNQA